MVALSPASRISRCLAFALCCLYPALAALAASETGLNAQIAAARDLMGTDLAQAHALLARTRAEAQQAGRLDVRLAADEIECRIFSDSDAEAAERVAASGVAAAAKAAAPAPAVTNALLRLRACWAGVQLDLGKMTVDDSTLTEIIAQADGPALAPARAMAQIERGLHRSRHGDLLEGQADLIEACATLRRLKLARDEELCLGHLANHYKRMGDTAEALRLLRELEEAAIARGAKVDRAVYVFGIGQVHAVAEAWNDALRAFEFAERLSAELSDAAGLAYATEGAADALLHLDRPREALPRAERALESLLALNDPGQVLNVKLVRAAALRALGDYPRAAGVLADVKDAIATAGTEYQRSGWFETDAEVQAKLGHWQRAYESLEAWRKLALKRHAQQLSGNGARLRLQFNRERDAAELRAMQQLNNQAAQLRRAQTAVVALAMLLAFAMLLFAVRKVRQSRRLQVLASTDELTGTLNRRAVMALAEQALDRATLDRAPLSILLVDVDHFKRINDRHGHPVGDRVLCELARALQAGLRAGDRLGRIGGEEFLIVLPDTASNDAAQIGERLRASCSALEIETTSGVLRFSISAGVASADHGGVSLAALIADADAALYAAKSGGRNAVNAFKPARLQPALAAS